MPPIMNGNETDNLISTITNYSMNSNASLQLIGQGENTENVPCISFTSQNSAYNYDKIQNIASIQAEDFGNYVFDIVFYTKIGYTGQSNNGDTIKDNVRSSKSNPILRIKSGVEITGTTVKILGICQTSAGFNISSALKYKKNIYDLPDNYNLDLLMKYRPIIYNLKVDEKENPTFFPGFIAEEIEDLGANLFVTYKDDKPDALDYSRICVHLVKAMQEMKTDYDSKISNLERKYEELKKMIDTMISKKV